MVPPRLGGPPRRKPSDGVPAPSKQRPQDIQGRGASGPGICRRSGSAWRGRRSLSDCSNIWTSVYRSENSITCPPCRGRKPSDRRTSTISPHHDCGTPSIEDDGAPTNGWCGIPAPRYEGLSRLSPFPFPIRGDQRVPPSPGNPSSGSSFIRLQSSRRGGPGRFRPGTFRETEVPAKGVEREERLEHQNALSGRRKRPSRIGALPKEMLPNHPADRRTIRSCSAARRYPPSGRPPGAPPPAGEAPSWPPRRTVHSFRRRFPGTSRRWLRCTGSSSSSSPPRGNGRRCARAGSRAQKTAAKIRWELMRDGLADSPLREGRRETIVTVPSAPRLQGRRPARPVRRSRPGGWRGGSGYPSSPASLPGARRSSRRASAHREIESARRATRYPMSRNIPRS